MAFSKILQTQIEVTDESESPAHSLSLSLSGLQYSPWLPLGTRPLIMPQVSGAVS